MHYYMKEVDEKGRAVKYFYDRPPKPPRGYLIDCDDFSVEQEFETVKRKAIALAKNMAKSSNTNARVLPCVDFVPVDDKPYYVVDSRGKVKEMTC